MNRSESQPAASRPPNPHHGLNLDDVYFTLFRHKWLILAFACLGVLGAVAVRIIRPPLYVSQAKLMIHYVANPTKPDPANPGQQVTPTEISGQSVINSEIEILTSLNVATNVANIIGPERILAMKGGGSDLMSAAGAICSGISVEPPRTAVITISFKHPDKNLVQPVLDELVKCYEDKHNQVRNGRGVRDVYYAQQMEVMRQRLLQTEEELKKAKTNANVLFPDETKRFYQERMSKVQGDLVTAQTELDTRRRILGEVFEAATPVVPGVTTKAPPADVLEEYSFVCSELESLKKQERELLRKYTMAYPVVENVHAQIVRMTEQKQKLEQDYQGLAVLSTASRGGTNTLGKDVSAELAKVTELKALVGALGTSLTNLETEAKHVMDVEPKIRQLERQREEEQRAYDYYANSLDQIRSGRNLASGHGLNMSMVQSATPPQIDYKKLLKLVGLALGGCLFLGLGLAFAYELVFDRTIKRATDIEKHLRLPVFLTIPDTTWTSGIRWPWSRKAKPALPANGEHGAESGTMAVAAWMPDNHLQTYTEGLRERLLTYFEVNNLGLKKPKLVAVTGCSTGSGVSTLASGLAAALSKTGDGNVLLVDMNVDQGVAHSFYRGKPGCGLTDVLEPDGREEARVEENLYLASINEPGEGKLAKVPPNQLSYIVPKLKGSDYDYIIFDMPPVSQTSVTPRMANYMDIVLLVLESEKTGQQRAARATAMMRESRSTVAAVLNKYRPHVPAGISQEL